MDNIETAMSRLCNRLMGAEQQALDTLTYTLDEMEYLAQQNPDREDIKNCIEEIKTKIKADEAVHWTIANRWSEHFDGIQTDSEDDETETEKTDNKDDDSEDKDSDD